MFNEEALGILAITANPPTYRKNPDGSVGGHMGMAMAVLDAGVVGEVWVVPAFRNPAKLGMIMASYADRLAMTALVVGDLPVEYRKRVYAKDIESKLVSEPDNGEPIFTHAVLDYITKMPENLDRAVHLILGSDYFVRPEGKKWRRLIPGWESRWGIIRRGMVMIPRLNNPITRDDVSERVRVVDRKPLNGCSGDGRNEKDFEALSLIVGASVASYMLVNGIYQDR